MFDSARGYRERVGRLLFGLPLDEYDELLLLLDRLANLRWAEHIALRRLVERLVIAPSETFVDHRSGRETGPGGGPQGVWPVARDWQRRIHRDRLPSATAARGVHDVVQSWVVRGCGCSRERSSGVRRQGSRWGSAPPLGGSTRWS